MEVSSQDAKHCYPAYERRKNNWFTGLIFALKHTQHYSQNSSLKWQFSQFLLYSDKSNGLQTLYYLSRLSC